MKLFSRRSSDSLGAKHSCAMDERELKSGRLGKRWKRYTLPGILMILLITILCFASLNFFKPAYAAGNAGSIFASSTTIPQLQMPEGLTSWNNNIFVSDFDINSPQNSRILVFNAKDGSLKHVIGGTPATQLVSAGPLLGLTIDPSTGYLYVAANGTGQVLRIQKPASDNPIVSVYATFPSGGGPEDMAFNKQGVLYISDSNLDMIYSIPQGGGTINKVVGPAGSGAAITDNGLLASSVGGSPNGLVFSLDYKTLYANNLGTDSVIAFDVNAQGQVTGHERTFAQHLNDDLEEYPTGDEVLIKPDTHFGASASTPLNGPDGLALDSMGRIWVASTLGDNLTVLDPKNGNVVATYGTSAVTQGGLLNNPASITFVGTTVYTTNLNFFKPNLPYTVVGFQVGVTGAGSCGNQNDQGNQDNQGGQGNQDNQGDQGNGCQGGNGNY
jgi:sugar lactone lactonase YvrE